jgi:hypothetical protein
VREVPLALLREFLPPDSASLPPFTFLHPGAFFLFSERLEYTRETTDAAGPILLARTCDGATFLPLPPLPFFHEDSSPRERGRLLAGIFAEISRRGNSPPPFLENCPLGLLPEGPFRFEIGEREVAISSCTLLYPRGNAGRRLRWEKNRLERLYGPVQVRRIAPGEKDSVRDLCRRFSDSRRSVACDDLERFLATDMESGFEKALDPVWEESLEGWLLEGGGRILAVGWYGRALSGRALLAYLEAREETVSNAGTVLMRGVLASGESLPGSSEVSWINIGGGAGLGGVRHSKKIRPHDLVLPLMRVVAGG